MQLTPTNTTPGRIDPVVVHDPDIDFDPLVDLTTMLEPLFTPLRSGGPAYVLDDHGNHLEADDIAHLLYEHSSGAVDPKAIDALHEMLSGMLLHYSNGCRLPLTLALVRSEAERLKLPDPSPRVMYSAVRDVIPQAKQLLARTPGADPAAFTAAIAYAFRPGIIGMAVRGPQEFAQMCEHMRQWVDAHAGNMSAETLSTFDDLIGSDLTDELVLSLRLRNDTNPLNDQWSFPRALQAFVTGYLAGQIAGPVDPLDAAFMPMDLSEIPAPQAFAFVNVEEHTLAGVRTVTTEWNDIRKAMASPIKLLSKQKLSKLTAVQRWRRTIQMTASGPNNNQPPVRAKGAAFRKTRPTPTTIHRDIVMTIKRMKKVAESQNVLVTSKRSFARANRRDPDNLDRAGKVTAKEFFPDIHVFLDCSGSIQENHYQATMITLIKLAKKMNVNMYFTSFSDYMSTATLVKTKDRSTKEIWKAFRDLPKVNGGTEFAQIWQYINARSERKRRLNIVITDFEWVPYSADLTIEHPKNIRYAPMSGMNWNRQARAASQFVRAMQYHDPKISGKLIGMVTPTS